MDWSQRKMEEGGGRGQCYLKRKKGRKNERKKEKETKTTQNNKRGEKKERWENFKKRFQTQITKYLKKFLSQNWKYGLPKNDKST